MKEFDELYTVEDIAQMTMLTSRTIRNYLKDGLLTGKKVGGQWRFTKKDVERLFDNKAVEADINDCRRQEIMDFINGVNTDMEGELQLCTIADYYSPDLQMAKTLSDRFQGMIAMQSAPTQHRFYYEYIEKEQKARYTFFGTPQFIQEAAGVLSEEWKRLNGSLSKFNHRAENYAKFRPSYPKACVEFIHRLTGKGRNVIADIGAGTGKMTELLLEQGDIVYAVEPNAEMRQQAEELLGSNKNFHSVSKAAENTSLRADSVDLLVCAEAYHWFDNENTILEFRRILKADGYGVLLWNNVGDNLYEKENGELYQKYAKKDSWSTISTPKEERAKNLFGEGNYQKITFENPILQPWEGFLGGALSASFAPQPGEENYEAYESGLRNIFNQYARDGLIETKFITTCYYGRLD